MESGKPQSMAIAYNMKRKKKMASGGSVSSKPKDDIPEPNKKNAEDFQRGLNRSDTDSKEWARNFKEGLGMAEGGKVHPHQSASDPHKKDGMDIEADEMKSGFVAHEGDVMRPNEMAIKEDNRKLGMHGEDEQGPDSMMMAHGGELHGVEEGHQDEMYEMDMVDRIMKKRQMHYSKGGMIANGGEDDLERMADGQRNNFDDLALRDDLESSYTGANSGDELSSDREDHDRADIVARIMSSRRKKDRMPRPA